MNEQFPAVETLRFSGPEQILPAIVQEAYNGQVLMLGYMNREAYLKTIETGLVTFYSRSRKQLWTKGETSGNRLRLVSIATDCDADALLITALPGGPVCHSGQWSCFGEKQAGNPGFLLQLEKLIQHRKDHRPAGSYTVQLLKGGKALMGRKVVEEATEVLLSVLGEPRKRVVEESADLLYHLLVLLVDQGIPLAEVVDELHSRHLERNK